jgi:ligand-binding SRPBCC domain-containing protein
MREVEVSRFVRATPTEVERALTPPSLVEYEGSFRVLDVHESDDATLVTAGARGLEMTLRFERVENGVRYVQEGEAGPFSVMETVVQVDREDEGARVTMRSSVSLGLPLSGVTDRIAAWKRRGELERALSALADDIE